MQIGRSPQLQLPLRTYPELGDQIWGLVLPTRPDGSEPVFLSTGSEQGPVQVFDSDGSLITNLRPGGDGTDVKGLPLRVVEIMPASGLLLNDTRRSPGVRDLPSPLGGGLHGGHPTDLAVTETTPARLHVQALQSQLAGFATELPR